MKELHAITKESRPRVQVVGRATSEGKSVGAK